jgi:hypothetical protein
LYAESEQQEPAVRRPTRGKIDFSQGQSSNEGCRGCHCGGVEERPTGPADIAVGLALDQEETGIGEASSDSEEDSETGVASVSLVSSYDS